MNENETNTDNITPSDDDIIDILSGCPPLSENGKEILRRIGDNPFKASIENDYSPDESVRIAHGIVSQVSAMIICGTMQNNFSISNLSELCAKYFKSLALRAEAIGSNKLVEINTGFADKLYRIAKDMRET